MRLVILDRDGVINIDSDAFIKTPVEWRALPGSIAAIADLSRAGFEVAVATNQSGIGRGLFPRQNLYAMHRKLRAAVAAAGGRLGRIVFCPHAPGDNCDCRKPKPGLLLRLGRLYRLPLDGVPVIGDSLRDLRAAIEAGARPMLVLTGKGKKTLDQLAAEDRHVEVFADLAAVAEHLIREAG